VPLEGSICCCIFAWH